jgi:acyl-CoA thioester hydrolase
MPRIKIALPDSFAFTTEIPLRISDINYGGHLGNDSVLSLMHEARVQYFRSLGLSGETSLEGIIGIIVSDVGIEYKSESFYGDVVQVEVGIDDVGKYGFDMVYRLTHKETGKAIAIGKTGILCFDYAVRKLHVIPAGLLQKLGLG